MSLARIVVVEDDPAIRRGVVDTLSAAGHHPVEAPDGAAGVTEAIRLGVDLVLLDLLLPKRDGLSVLAEVRKVRPALPVIILTARGGEDDRVKGLKLGADDYVVKPFSARELLARVEAVLRRSPGRAASGECPPAARFGDAVIDLLRREVRRPGRPRVELSETEAAILGLLLARRDRAVTREEILTRLWGVGTGGIETRTVDMHVARLRGKLRRPDGEGPDAVVTVRATGYMAAPELVPADDAAGATAEGAGAGRGAEGGGR